MSTDTENYSFRRPNLEAVHGVSPEAWISVRADRSTIGINAQACEAMHVNEGHYLHRALDRTGTPWIGVLETRTEKSEPRIRDADPGMVVGSKLMARHLLGTMQEVPEDSIRFYLTGEQAVDRKMDVTLYQLSPDKEDADLYMQDFE